MSKDRLKKLQEANFDAVDGMPPAGMFTSSVFKRVHAGDMFEARLRRAVRMRQRHDQNKAPQATTDSSTQRMKEYRPIPALERSPRLAEGKLQKDLVRISRTGVSLDWLMKHGVIVRGKTGPTMVEVPACDATRPKL